MSRRGFWKDALTFRGSVTPKVLPDVLGFGLISTVICACDWQLERWLQVPIGLEVAPHEIFGAALGLLLILRTNAGYDRWWEARKLWGGIVNQSRNLVIAALAYGPTKPEWRHGFVRWASAFPHVARSSLRGVPLTAEVAALIGPADTHRVQNSAHMPSCVALQLAGYLRSACQDDAMDRFAFQQLDQQRALLIDHIGACERILKTPLPLVYSIKIRRFIALFLVTLPFVLLHRLQSEWLVPLITMLVAYPLLALDRIGAELQNPFSEKNLSHLPLTEISLGIEQTLMGLLHEQRPLPADGDGSGLSQANFLEIGMTPAARRA